MSSLALLLSTPADGTTSARRHEPITLGVPLPQGLSTEPRPTGVDANGNRIAIQSAVLDRWPDGSARWALLDFQADVHGPATPISVRFDQAQAPLPAIATEGSGRVTIDTGVAQFVVGRNRYPFESVKRGGSALSLGRCAFRLTDRHGDEVPPSILSVVLEENGPLRAAVRVSGTIPCDGHGLEFTSRLHFFSGKAVVKVEITLRNPRRAHHKDGYWELGDSGSMFFRDASLELALPSNAGAPTARLSEHVGDPLSARPLPLTLYQDSSGGDHWRSTTHVNRDGAVPVAFKGYRVTAGGAEGKGARATPVLQAAADGVSIAVTMPRFWENFPKAIEMQGITVSLRLFPAAFADLHELQGGEQKTHTAWIGFGDDTTSDRPLDWCRVPATVAIDPDWSCASGVIPMLTPREDDPHRGYLALVDSAIAGPDSFAAKREAIDEYGWRDFGEVYADHEAVFHGGEQRLVSHYNNQYDAVAGMAYQFLRSGDPVWWDPMDELAKHVIDIDIYHTDADWPKYNHGLFWHTVHYVDAGRSTHRTYPRAKGSNGGGPSAGHLYTTGLLLHYFLTGSRQSRDAAIELGVFSVDSDDGRRSIFGWIDSSPTGHISMSVGTYHGPGRASGNALNALVDAHRLSGDRKFLDKAEELIRRVIHPHDNIEQWNLLDAERRWFYTMFLQSLGKFLMHKRELGQLDFMYAYGRESLLYDARWMAEHERPYLERPEILEYPTETWAAQDMRKCEVFQWAATHASGAEQQRFLARAHDFFQHSVEKLSSMPTKTLARPVILLLSYGWSHAAFQRGLPKAEPSAPADHAFGQPVPFVPQRDRVVKKLKVVVVAGAVAAIAAALALAAYVWL